MNSVRLFSAFLVVLLVCLDSSNATHGTKTTTKPARKDSTPSPTTPKSPVNTNTGSGQVVAKPPAKAGARASHEVIKLTKVVYEEIKDVTPQVMSGIITMLKKDEADYPSNREFDKHFDPLDDNKKRHELFEVMYIVFSGGKGDLLSKKDFLTYIEQESTYLGSDAFDEFNQRYHLLRDEFKADEPNNAKMFLMLRKMAMKLSARDHKSDDYQLGMHAVQMIQFMSNMASIAGF